jgi:hypothetical protein
MVRWLDISRIIRNNKRTLDTQIPTMVRVPRRNNSDKVIDSLKEAKSPLTFSEILYASGIRSSGNLHNILRLLVDDKVVVRNVELYNLI